MYIYPHKTEQKSVKESSIVLHFLQVSVLNASVGVSYVLVSVSVQFVVICCFG